MSTHRIKRDTNDITHKNTHEIAISIIKSKFITSAMRGRRSTVCLPTHKTTRSDMQPNNKHVYGNDHTLHHAIGDTKHQAIHLTNLFTVCSFFALSEPARSHSPPLLFSFYLFSLSFFFYNTISPSLSFSFFSPFFFTT